MESDEEAWRLVESAAAAAPTALPLAGEEAAWQRWRRFRDEDLADYADLRDRPDLARSSRLSPYLKLGVLHPRSLLAEAGAGPGADRFVTELAWREVYADVLHHHPGSAWHDLRAELAGLAYADLADPQVAQRVDAWRCGRTGYPLVDAGMRQLLTEGWMHNRVRMVTASFLTQGIGYVWGFALLGGIGALVFTTLRDRDGRGQFAEYDRLLHEHGSTSIGWMARWPGMSYWVDPARTAGFAYRLENNIAIVLSDPVGSPDAVATSLGGFTEMCDRRGWRPVFYSVTESFRALAAQHGYQAIVVGEDTVIDLPDLAFTGKSWQSVRTAVNQAGKLGISMRPIRYAEATAGMRVQLQAIAASWSDDKSLPPLGFTLGTLAEASDPEVIMHVAVDAEGTVHGMTSWMPVYGQGTVDGWTLDIMQRGLSEDTMRGVVEFLIAESAMAFKQEGYRFISLSASPLSRGEGQTGPIEALLDMVAKRLEPLYGFQSLHNFKAKFKPRFEPMYLCYRDEAQLPAISIAIIKAYLPDNALRGVVASKIK